MGSAQVDAAVVGRLLGDSTLMGMCPDGVFFDVAAQGSQAFIAMGLVSHLEERQFGGVAWGVYKYEITAIALNSSGVDMGAAADRIDALFDDTPFPIAGHTWMRSIRVDYVRTSILDPENTSIRWQHRGGVYEVRAIPLVAPPRPDFTGVLGTLGSTLGAIVPGQL